LVSGSKNSRVTDRPSSLTTALTSICLSLLPSSRSIVASTTSGSFSVVRTLNLVLSWVPAVASAP
jgi:hypothetical protein